MEIYGNIWKYRQYQAIALIGFIITIMVIIDFSINLGSDKSDLKNFVISTTNQFIVYFIELIELLEKTIQKLL